MRKYINIFVSVAAAAMALVSCQVVEESIIEKPSGEARTIRVHATAQELANEDTKTYINAEETILWGTGEYMKLAVTPEGETPVFANSTDESADIFDGEPTALFEFSVAPTSAASYLYQGIYPASAAATNSNTNPANYKVILPATQNATATSYDPAAYIMVAKPETFDQVESDWAVKFRRATALNKITLKNVPGGKSINKVTITASDGKYLAGGRHFNLSTGDSGDIYSGGGRTETVTVKFATPAAGGANIDVWFTSWEVSLVADDVLTIVAYTTDKKSYTKTITLAGAQTISFREGYLNTLGANMSGIDPEDVTELEEGDYLVLAKNGANYYALKAEKDPSGERLLSVDYTGSLDSYLGDADLIWSISKSGDSYIFENDGKNLGYKGTKNESYWLEADAEWTGDNYLLDVTVHEYPTYYVTLNSNASRYLSKNNPGSFFAFYGNTGQYADIVFVPASVDTRTVVTLSFDEDAVGFTTANYDSFLGQDVTASPDVAAVTEHLSWSKVDDDSVIDDFDNGVLTLTGNEGTATVTVSFAGDEDYRPAQASYTIEVSGAGSITLTDSEIATGSNTVKGTNSGKLAYRLGTGSNDGSLTFDAGYSSITFTLAGWASGTRSFTITNGKIDDSTSLSPSAGTPSGNINAGFSTSYEGTEYTIIVDDPSEEVVFSGRRCVVWGFTAVEATPDTRDEAGLAWKKGGVEANTDTASIEEGDDVMPTITLYNPNDVDVEYSSSNTGVATINASTGAINLVAAGETVISAIFADGDPNYKPQTVSYTLTVTDNTASYDFESVAELNALVTGESTSYSGYLTGAVVSFVPATNTAIVKDATGSIMFYKASHGLKQGQTYTGAINVTAIKYNSLYSEITVWDASFTGSETTVAPESVSLSSLIGHYDDYQNAYVQVTGLQVTGVSSKNINVTDGVNNYVVYDNPGTATCIAGDVITVKGTVTKYDTTEEIKVWAASGITITSYAPRAISFTQPTGAAADAGCSIAVSVGGSPIVSGTTVASGTTVTITATEGTDYEFTSWTVEGATVADASSATTSFVMGHSAVTVSASFSSTGGGGDPEPVDKTYSFAFATMGSTGWSSSYGDHNNVYNDSYVSISIKSASKQSGTITDYPVTKAGDVIVILKDGTMSAVTFTLTQWTTKAKTVSLQYSTDGGSTFSAMSPAVSSNNFTLSSSSLPTGTNAVKMVQGNTSNQVGLNGVSFTYTPSN